MATSTALLTPIIMSNPEVSESPTDQSVTSDPRLVTDTDVSFPQAFVPLSSDKAGQASELEAGQAGELEAGQAGELEAGQAGELEAGQAGELVAGQAGELVAGQAGELVAGQAGEVVAGQAGELVAGQAGELVAGQAGELVAGQAGELEAGQAGELEAGQASELVKEKTSVPPETIMTPQEAPCPAVDQMPCLAFGEHLTEFERKEIQGYSEKHKDHIAYRYEVLQLMGKGACGQGEVKMLKLLQTDDNKITNVIQMKENFYFRDHMCITFDLMTMDLFDMMCARNRTGLPTPQIKHHTVSLLQALRFLSQKNIIHCDLKPWGHIGGGAQDDPVPQIFILNIIKALDKNNCAIAGWHGWFADELHFYLEFELLHKSLWAFLGENGLLYLTMEDIRTVLNQLEYMSETQGPFPDHMLAAGTKSMQFFNKEQLWTLKLLLCLKGKTDLPPIISCWVSDDSDASGSRASTEHRPQQELECCAEASSSSSFVTPLEITEVDSSPSPTPAAHVQSEVPVKRSKTRTFFHNLRRTLCCSRELPLSRASRGPTLLVQQGASSIQGQQGASSLLVQHGASSLLVQQGASALLVQQGAVDH
ncbi:hypothetical protein CRUP_026510 [Coryphaenoides rupestris]|nr:hypothetical protein CRUP_026510 [Coryphaenoides rupestris]